LRDLLKISSTISRFLDNRASDQIDSSSIKYRSISLLVSLGAKLFLLILISII